MTDQAERADADADLIDDVRKFAERAERFSDGRQARAAVANLNAVSNQAESAGFDDLAQALREIVDDLG